MILYLCEICGKWLDISFARMLTNALKKIPGADMPSGVACPNGCGLMHQIQVTDRLCLITDIRSASAGFIEFRYEGKTYRGELFEVKE